MTSFTRYMAIQTYSARQLAKETGIPLERVLNHAKELRLPRVGSTTIINADDAVRILDRATTESKARATAALNKSAELENQIEQTLVHINRLANSWIQDKPLIAASNEALAECRASKWATGPQASARPAAARLTAAINEFSIGKL